MAIDRPDDIGQQFPSDATSLSLPDVHEGRTQIDYGTRPDAIETLPPVALTSETEDPNPIREFNVFVETDEFLIVKEIFIDDNGDEVESDILSFVAKPIALRKSTYDGIEDADDFLQTSITSNRRSLVRTNSGNTFTRFEEISPEYFGSRIFAIAATGTGLPGISLLDTNNDLRRWVSDEPRNKYFQIIDINKDTFVCQEWDYLTDAQKLDEDDVLLPAVNVAKLTELRGSFWNGLTEEGRLYTVVGGSNEADPFILRTAFKSPDTENHEIIPPVVVNSSIIKTERVDNGTGAIRSNTESLWQDSGNSRGWSEIFV